MARKEKKKSKPRNEPPAIFTAAGLLAFYQEEEAVVKLSPLAVIVVSVAFIAFTLALHLLP